MKSLVNGEIKLQNDSSSNFCKIRKFLDEMQSLDYDKSEKRTLGILKCHTFQL